MNAMNALIALALGYLVLTVANKEKKSVRLLGRAIGAFVILSSAIWMVCASAACLQKGSCSPRGYGAMGMAQGMDASMCPMMSKSSKAKLADKMGSTETINNATQKG